MKASISNTEIASNTRSLRLHIHENEIIDECTTETRNSRKPQTVELMRGAKFILILYSICAIVSPGEIFFATTSYLGGRLSSMPVMANLIGAFLIIVYMVRMRIPFDIKNTGPAIFYLLMILIWYRFGFTSQGLPLNSMIRAIHIFGLVSLDYYSRRTLLYYIGLVFAVIMLPGLLFFIMNLVGINPPMNIVSSKGVLKELTGIYYLANPFGVMRSHANGTFDFCGIYDEAGCVGTYAALLYAVIDTRKELNDIKYTKFIKGMIAIEASASFSFAAYLILGAYIIVKAITERNSKTISVAVIFIVLLIIISNIQTDNTMLARLQERLNSLLGEGYFSDNRMSAQALYKMDEFYTTDMISIKLFGFGPDEFGHWQNANLVDASSVLSLLYNYGYVGIALYYALLIVLNRYPSKRLSVKSGNSLLPLMLFLASTYQRPGILNTFGFALLVLPNPGIELLKESAKEKSLEERSIIIKQQRGQFRI